MNAQVLPFPLRRRDRNGEPGEAGAKMHARFEMLWLIDAIVGARPEVRILQIAWYEKRRQVAGFVRACHARHAMLPRGCHDLGVTADHGLRVGRVDFDAARMRLCPESRPRRWPGLALLPGRFYRSGPGRRR